LRRPKPTRVAEPIEEEEQQQLKTHRTTQLSTYNNTTKYI